MSLTVDWEEFFGDGSNHGIYTETASWKDSSDERGASLEYFTADGLEEFQADAAVEIQGHSSTTRWNTDKLSLQVKFKNPYDTKLETATLFGNSVIAGQNAAREFDTFILDAQFNYTWLHGNTQQNGVAKYVNDQVVSDMINLAGGHSPHGRWVHLYINGVYWGIYNAHERPDESFAAAYYGGNKDDYFAVKAFDGNAQHPAQYLQVEGGLTAESAYAQLLDETQDNLTDAAEYQQVAALLDVDEFIDYMIIHYYAGNWDWGQDNWYATFNHVAEDGLWRFHAWDQEHAWPTDDNLALGETNFNQNYNSTTKDDAYGPTGIQHQLMLNEEYRLKFADRVQELMYNDGLLTPTVAASVFQTRADEIDRAIAAESARWGDDRISSSGKRYDRQDWLENIAGLMTDFFPVRTAIVLQQFDSAAGGKTDWIPSLAAPLLNQYGGEIAAGFDLVMSTPAGTPAGATIYYTVDGTDPRLEGGDLNPAAIPYAGAVDLATSLNVKARIFFDNSGTANDWSPLVNESFLVDTEGRLPLRIVELMYNPPGSADDTEYFELLNTGDAPIELTGVSITDFSTDGYTFTSGTLAAGERIVVVKDQAAFAAAYPGVTNLAAGVFSGSLANEGELVSLRGPLGELLQSFAYGDKNVAGWPASPDGDGYSLEYKGPFDAGEDPSDGAPADPFDVPSNWRASLQLGGSPGTSGAAAPLAGDYDGLGTVDAADYTVWKTTFGNIVAPGTGADGNGNGVVDAADYTVWRDNLGALQASSAGGGSNAAGLSSAAPVNRDSMENGAAPKQAETAATELAFELEPIRSADGHAAAVRQFGGAVFGPRQDASLLLLQSLRNAETSADEAGTDPCPARRGKTIERFERLGLWDDEVWVTQLGRETRSSRWSIC